MHDIIVIGGGVAGMTAALYALRNGKSVLIFEGDGVGAFGWIRRGWSVLSGYAFCFDLFPMYCYPCSYQARIGQLEMGYFCCLLHHGLGMDNSFCGQTNRKFILNSKKNDERTRNHTRCHPNDMYRMDYTTHPPVLQENKG